MHGARGDKHATPHARCQGSLEKLQRSAEVGADGLRMAGTSPLDGGVDECIRSADQLLRCCKVIQFTRQPLDGFCKIVEAAPVALGAKPATQPMAGLSDFSRIWRPKKPVAPVIAISMSFSLPRRRFTSLGSR